MNQGLIPVISDPTSIDIGDFGVRINPCTIEEIERTVNMLSTYSPALCKQRSLATRAAAVRNFSQDEFSRRFEAAVLGMARDHQRRKAVACNNNVWQNRSV